MESNMELEPFEGFGAPINQNGAKPYLDVSPTTNKGARRGSNVSANGQEFAGFDELGVDRFNSDEESYAAAAAEFSAAHAALGEVAKREDV